MDATDLSVFGQETYFNEKANFWKDVNVSGYIYGDGSKLTGISGNTSGNISIIDDTSTNDIRYILFDDVTSGIVSTANVSSTKLQFNPSTGTLSATVFTSLSDRNLKYNINTITDAINKIKNLRGVSFNWKQTDKPSLGVIAQEIEKFFPELICGNSVKSVNYDGIIGILIEALKEQQKEIDVLKEKIDYILKNLNQTP